MAFSRVQYNGATSEDARGTRPQGTRCESRERPGNSEGLIVPARLQKGPGHYSFDSLSASVLTVNRAFTRHDRGSPELTRLEDGGRVRSINEAVMDVLCRCTASVCMQCDHDGI